MKQAQEIKLEDLSPAARQALETRRLQGRFDVRSLGRILHELSRWDAMAERRKGSAKKWLIGSAIGSFVGFMVFMFTAAITENFLWPLPILLIPLALLFVSIRRRRAAMAIDLPNEISGAILPVLKILRHDAHPEEKATVALNLKCFDEKQHLTQTELPPGRNRKLVQKTYQEPLGSIRVPLADGAVVSIRIENLYLRLERSYRSSRGKYKSKTKWKKMTRVRTQLQPGVPTSWQSGRAQQLVDRNMETLTFVERKGVMCARMERFYKFKAMSDAPGDTATGKDILRMLVRLNTLRPAAGGGAR